MPNIIMQTCEIHGETDHYLSPNSKTPRCKRCNVERVSKRRRSVISILRRAHGDACIECGYDREPTALVFHHIDPTTKSFPIGSGATHSLEKLREEASKCILVCANCHAEIHAGTHLNKLATYKMLDDCKSKVDELTELVTLTKGTLVSVSSYSKKMVKVFFNHNGVVRVASVPRDKIEFVCS